MTMKHPPSTRAFTLMELLICMSIIAVLAVMIGAVVGRVQQSGRDAKCLSNLRQYAVANQHYVSDNNGYFPKTAWDSSGNYGHYALMSYFVDKSAKKADKIQMLSCPQEEWIYGLNVFISEMNAAAISDPARTIFGTCCGQGWLDTNAITGKSVHLKVTPKPHTGRISVVRLDGHVTLERVSQLVIADMRRDTQYYDPADEKKYFLNGDTQYDK
jgi:prepilin-type N-terminal cleavage/methylation domain-containing protein